MDTGLWSSENCFDQTSYQIGIRMTVVTFKRMQVAKEHILRMYRKSSTKGTWLYIYEVRLVLQLGITAHFMLQLNFLDRKMNHLNAVTRYLAYVA